MESSDKKPQSSGRKETKSVGQWVALGVAIGVGIGAAMNNIAIGAGIGAALGAAVGSMMSKRKADSEPSDHDDNESN